MYLTYLIFNNWPDIIVGLIIFFAVLIPIFPCQLAGFTAEYYDFNLKKMVKQRKFSLIEIPIHMLGHLIVTGFGLTIGYRGTITLLLFLVLGTDLVLQGKISDNAVKVSIVAIIALYLEKILDSADEITLWKIFTWRSKNTIPLSPPQTSDQQ